MKKLVIIGNTSNARLARVFFDDDSEYEVVAFSVNQEYLEEDTFEGLPVVPFEALESHYPPEQYDAFVAVGYTNMNTIREKLYHATKAKGYTLPNYISSHCTFLTKEPMGDNNMILEDNTVQPFVTIGSNNVLWSGNHIGHDVTIGDHTYITSHVVISGFTRIGNHCFLGVNATFRDDITIADKTLVAAGACIMKDTEAEGVYLAPQATKYSKKSSEIKIS